MNYFFVQNTPSTSNTSGDHHKDGTNAAANAAAASSLNLTQPMDTVFVKEVRPYGPAHFAGLKTGDRLLSVNGMPVAGTPYNRVVAAIQQAPSTLTLHVVPKECDILQTVIIIILIENVILNKRFFFLRLYSFSAKLLITQRRINVFLLPLQFLQLRLQLRLPLAS